MNFFTELVNRWDKDSPIFFKKIGRAGLVIGGIGAAILATQVDGTNINLPEWLLSIASHMVTVGVIAKIVAAWTVKDPDYSTLDQPKSKVKDAN